MTAAGASLDLVAIGTYLQIDAAPNNDAYRVTIQVPGLDVVVQAIERDIADALHTAADECAKRLREQGYPVTGGDVLNSLNCTEGGLPKQGLS